MEDHQLFSMNSVCKSETGLDNSVEFKAQKDFWERQKQNKESVLKIKQKKFHQDKVIYYYNLFFSPKQMAESLKKRNDNLQMLNFQNSDQEPDDVYNRRKKKVADLINKQEYQLESLLKLKIQDEGKFIAIIQFIRIFCVLKEQLSGVRTDYYSSKTFSALKNSSQAQVVELTKVVQRMFENIMNQSSKFTQTGSQTTNSQSNKFDQRLYQFLIIPRFLISKQKIIRLCKDQVLQSSFQFLVYNKCLGHYNNEANKKMPQQKHMVYVRNLLTQNLGRQKFKKICSINHGNKFLRSHSRDYYQLYFKSLQYLKQLDASLKKGKKYEAIRKQLQKLPSQQDINSLNSNLTQNQSSNSIYNFKMMDECLSKLSDKKSQSEIMSEMRDEPAEINQLKPIIMKKGRVKKLMSMPVNQKQYEQIEKQFCLKKYSSMQATRTTENIIIIHPPFHSEI